MNTTFNINILAPGKKKKKYPTSNMILLFMLPLITWMLVAGGLYLFYYLPTYKVRQKQQQNLQNLSYEEARLKTLHRKLEKQQTMYLVASRESIDWSSKLISFSLMIPKDIWISRLLFVKDEKSKNKSRLLDIYGQTISMSHKESLDKIAVFIEKMNKEAAFRKEFSPLEFNYSQLLDAENRLMNFKLSSSAKFAQRTDKH